MTQPRRFTQHSPAKLLLEKIVKSNVYFYKLSFEIKKHMGSLFHEEDLDGIDHIDFGTRTACIDIGANVGQSIEVFRKRFSTIYAFEPNPGNFNSSKRNTTSPHFRFFPLPLVRHMRRIRSMCPSTKA